MPHIPTKRDGQWRVAEEKRAPGATAGGTVAVVIGLQNGFRSEFAENVSDR